MTAINIIGAGGHARSVISLLKNNSIEIASIYDTNYIRNESIMEIPVSGTLDEINMDTQAVLAIGCNIERERLFEKFKSFILPKSIMHSSAVIEPFTKIGYSNMIFSRCVINSQAELGKNNIINTGAILEHEVTIGSHNHISVNSVLLGRVRIGNRCTIGSCAVIKENIKICDDVIIGANSFVSSDITESGTYVGNPVRRIS